MCANFALLPFTFPLNFVKSNLRRNVLTISRLNRWKLFLSKDEENGSQYRPPAMWRAIQDAGSMRRKFWRSYRYFFSSVVFGLPQTDIVAIWSYRKTITKYTELNKIVYKFAGWANSTGRLSVSLHFTLIALNIWTAIILIWNQWIEFLIVL